MASKTVTVWIMPVGTPSPAALARWHAVLDQKEAAQAARFRAEGDRHTYIAAHALTRALLASVGDRPAEQWRFQETEKGKPEILNGPDLHFSHSHTNGLVVCAAAAGAAVGIDTESRDRKQKQSDIAQAILSSAELALLAAQPAERHQEIFLRLWTLREAYVKATGQGISFPRENFAFVLDPPAIQLANGNKDDAWQFSNWDENRHIVSLAVNSSLPIDLMRREVTEDELLNSA